MSNQPSESAEFSTSLGNVESIIVDGVLVGYEVTTPGGEIVVSAGLEDAEEIATSIALASIFEP